MLFKLQKKEEMKIYLLLLHHKHFGTFSDSFANLLIINIVKCNLYNYFNFKGLCFFFFLIAFL